MYKFKKQTPQETDLIASPFRKGNMNSPARRRLADISNTPPSAKKVKHFTESLPVIKVIIV